MAFYTLFENKNTVLFFYFICLYRLTYKCVRSFCLALCKKFGLTNNAAQLNKHGGCDNDITRQTIESLLHNNRTAFVQNIKDCTIELHEQNYISTRI